MKRIDLHVHTTASDGTLRPAEVVSLAASLGLCAIAITDHDNVSGFAEASAKGKELGIEVIPGIELSTAYFGPVHILGYGLDVTNPELAQVLQSIIEDRDTRNQRIVERMREDGIPIAYEAMRARFGTAIGRPHFAEILMENGLASTPNEAFLRYLSKGERYWFPRTTVSLARCIELIRLAGGIPVLAHPFEYKYDTKSLANLIETCIGFGIEGIECRHSSHTPGQMVYLEHLADEYGLLKTGGSDFHGSIKPGIQLGTGSGLISVPESWLVPLHERLGRKYC